MSFSGNHGYVKVNGTRLALTKSWDMSESEGPFYGSPGNHGTVATSINITVHASAVASLDLIVGSYVDLDLLEGGDATYFYELYECRITAIDFTGAAVNQLVERSIQLETFQTKEIKDVI